MTKEQMKTRHGTVKHQDQVLILVQDAYPGDNDDFQAEAIADTGDAEGYDEDGYRVRYRVSWPISNPTAENAEDCCDWADYTVTGPR